MDMVLDYIKDNKGNFLLGSMVLMSLFANLGSNGQIAYYIATIVGAFIVFSKKESVKFLFFLLIIWLILGSLFNNVLDVRLGVFALLIMCASPLFSSYENFIFRAKFLYAICMLLPVVTMLNLYAYRVGINYFVMLNYNVSDINFSGFTPHPMWLGAINGASNVVLTYLLMKVRDEDGKKIYQCGVLVLLLSSLYLSVVAASRGAFASSLIAMAGVVYYFSETGGKLVKSVFAAFVIAVFLMPILEGASVQMQKKMNDEETGGNSRALIWEKRIEEFMDSPIVGIGFATAFDLEKGEIVTGTVETGSGWLTILSQSGIIGFILILTMLRKSYVPIKEIKEDRGVLVLFMCLGIYLCVHSIFEGYIYTPGYCPCLFFWLVLGFLHEYNAYKDDYDDVLEEIEYMYLPSSEDDEEDATIVEETASDGCLI